MGTADFDHPVEAAAIAAARLALSAAVHRTPLLTCRSFDALAGRPVLLKAENLQGTGSFKLRGATNAVACLPAGTRCVVTHSSGNFAQALARAATARGLRSRIVMPTNAPEAKRAAVIAYGGEVVPCAPNLIAREDTAAREVAATGGVLVHPYDDPAVIAGQGTIAAEILEDAPGVGAIVAPVGGGGLVSGIALGARFLRPDVAVWAAEPAGADDAARSRLAGRLLPQEDPRTVADGLRTSLGNWTWPVIRDVVAGVAVVPEEAIVAAMRLLWERAKLVVEPSGAVPLAAVLARSIPGSGPIAVVLSGGNVDLDRLPWLSPT